MHRDLKLANILIHFPDEKEFSYGHFKCMTDKINFVNNKLKYLNLLESNFSVKIADLGFSREL